MVPDFFKRVIQSVLSQTFESYELIITDDSPDNSISDIISNLNIKVPLKYIKNNIRLGAPANWNRAIGLATGQYIKILHHDDWLLSPQSLFKFVDLMERHPQASMGFSSSEAYDRNHLLKSVHIPTEDKIAELRKDHNILFWGNLIGPPSSIIFKRTPGLSFDENLRWLVDIDFYVRLLEKKSFAFCTEPLVGVTAESAHQVTRECENNKMVEVYEYLYLFSKLSHKRKQFIAYMRFFSQLFKRFSINSSRELAALSKDVKIPWYLNLLADISR